MPKTIIKKKKKVSKKRKISQKRTKMRGGGGPDMQKLPHGMPHEKNKFNLPEAKKTGFFSGVANFFGRKSKTQQPFTKKLASPYETYTEGNIKFPDPDPNKLQEHLEKKKMGTHNNNSDTESSEEYAKRVAAEAKKEENHSLKRIINSRPRQILRSNIPNNNNDLPTDLKHKSFIEEHIKMLKEKHQDPRSKEEIKKSIMEIIKKEENKNILLLGEEVEETLPPVNTGKLQLSNKKFRSIYLPNIENPNQSSTNGNGVLESVNLTKFEPSIKQKLNLFNNSELKEIKRLEEIVRVKGQSGVTPEEARRIDIYYLSRGYKVDTSRNAPNKYSLDPKTTMTPEWHENLLNQYLEKEAQTHI